MDFKSKIGPLPAWAWGLIIGGIAVIWMWVNSMRDVPTVVTPESSGDADYGGSVVDGAPGGDFNTVPVLPTPPIESETGADTNSDWLRRAVAAAVNNGSSTLSAQTALQKYLNGQTLSTSEQSIVNYATGKIGLPPENVDTPDTAPGPKPESLVAKISISSASKMKRGRAYPLTVTVKWASSTGRVNATPAGRVRFAYDGKEMGTQRLVAGKAIRIIGPMSKKNKFAKDGVIKVTARYLPSPATERAGVKSVTAQKVIRVPK